MSKNGAFDYLIVLAKRKRLIILITCCVAVGTIVYSLFLPRIYRASASILPPQQSSQSLANQMLGGITALSGIAGGALGIKNPNDLYIGMLKSRTVLDRMIDRFNLKSRYQVHFYQDARARLGEYVNLRYGKDGIINIAVEDTDPKMAADMANAFVAELKKLMQQLAVTEAAQRRLFYEDRLKTVEMNLANAEEAMKRFQEKTGVLKLDDQAKVLMETSARLRAQIANKQVELQVMKTYATPSNPDVQRLETEIKSLKAEMGRFEEKESRPGAILPSGNFPSSGLDYLRKLREIKYNETLSELLKKQYELAKLDEVKDSAVIQVVEEAVPPEKATKPKRRAMVMGTTFAAFFGSLLLALIIEFTSKICATAEFKEKMALLKHNLSFRKAI